MDEGVEQSRKEASQHNRLGRQISTFHKIVLLCEYIILQSSTDTLFFDSFGEEGHIRSIKANKKLLVSRALDMWCGTHVSSPRWSMKFFSVIASGGSTTGSWRMLSCLYKCSIRAPLAPVA